MIAATELPASVALALTFGLSVLGAVVILLLGWFVAGYVATLVRRSSERHPNIDRTLAQVFARVVRIAILAFTFIAVLNQFGIATTSIVALLGAAGLAVGLALQGTLGNVASGVVLLVLRPFRIGDAIDASGVSGVVQDIGLFATRLTSFDGVPIFVPNSRLWGGEIKNFSMSERRRIDMIFGIDYKDDMDKALQIIRDVIEKDPRVMSDPEPLIAIADLNDSSVDIWVRPWTKPGDFMKTKLDVTKRIKERFDEEGISIPFPQHDIHVIGNQPVAGKPAA